MKARRVVLILFGLCAVGFGAYPLFMLDEVGSQAPPDREEVLFWHFWGGEDRDVVDSIVDRFNNSQDRYFVRAIAMPGNNLDVKVFLAVAGGDPPDVINQDDPIIADWAKRGALMPLDEFASADELAQLRTSLFPAARKLVEYDNRMYGLCNGLDIRALYYNKTLLDEHNLGPPDTPNDLMQIAQRLSLQEDGRQVRFGYLPDSRRLWAWGIVFGGEFYDTAEQRVTANDPAIVRALDWMQSFSREFGSQQVAAFRTGDQSLPGKTFPLLPVGDSPHGRYAMIMDGQWRVRDIARSKAARVKADLPVDEYSVCPLPAPAGGRESGGWVNGNFFVVPRGANNSAGAWEFMKFWSGASGHETEAAEICATGGWIPVSQNVVDQPRFKQYLREQPLFAEFVTLAASEDQFPIPAIPGAPYFNREIKSVGARAMADENASPQELLNRANVRIQEQVNRAKE